MVDGYGIHVPDSVSDKNATELENGKNDYKVKFFENFLDKSNKKGVNLV